MRVSTGRGQGPKNRVIFLVGEGWEIIFSRFFNFIILRKVIHSSKKLNLDVFFSNGIKLNYQTLNVFIVCYV